MSRPSTFDWASALPPARHCRQGPRRQAGEFENSALYDHERMRDETPLPHGPDVALAALDAALERLRTANAGLLRGKGGAPIWIALTESLLWVAALDDRFRRTVPDYFTCRAADACGRATGGLVFARNMHVHELVTTGAAVFIPGTARLVITPAGEPRPPPGRGTALTIELRWAHADGAILTGARDRQHRDAMYRECVSGRLLSEPFADAVVWLSACRQRTV